MIAFLIDADNLSSPAWIDEAFHKLATSEGSILIRRAYGSAENLKGLTDTLRTWAIRPFVNLALSKNTTDVALAVDAMELACLPVRPSTIVIGSGDADYVPLVVRLRERGIRMVCVSEFSKFASDAESAYDHVNFVGKDQRASATGISAVIAVPVSDKQKPAPAKKAGAKSPPVKKVASKSVPVKKTPAKKLVTKTPGVATATVTVPKILAAYPSLEAGQWQPLGVVAKALHDEKLLAKSAPSTKLFRKFPHHFELMPEGKPNQVRFILQP